MERMIDTLTDRTDDLYERDFYEWSVDRAARLREHRGSGLDWGNIAEEVESLGNRDRRNVASRLTLIVLHLLKWTYQSEHRTRSWRLTLATQRRDLNRVLERSPSLKRFLDEDLERLWRDGVRDAARETGLPVETFPANPTHTLEQLLDPDLPPSERE